MSEAVERNTLPTYAVFDDYRYTQRIAVVVRWFLLAAWLFVLNYRVEADSTLFILDGMGVALIAVNGYVHWRLWRGRPGTRAYVLALSIMDLSIITAGIGITSRFDNTFFVFYYPALLGLSLVFSSRRLSFAAVTAVAAAYLAISLALDPGISVENREERVLTVRIVTMFAVVAAANLMVRLETSRRREAVEAERARAQENLELQKKAQEAALAAQEERARIAREIHDGVAQSMYALSLSLETCADLAERENGPVLRDRLQKLVPLAKKTLLETRHYICDLKPLLAGESGLEAVAENQAKEFEMVSGLPVSVSVQGEPFQVPMAVATGFYRLLQEALANVLKHARASKVTVDLTFEPGLVRLTVRDDGAGFDVDNLRPGYGLDNMRDRAEEMGGTFEMTSAPDEGTCISVALPAQEVKHEVN